jgi:hypothetical protein
LLIGWIMAALTEKEQALHDILAKCLVVYRNPQAGCGRFRKIKWASASGAIRLGLD